VSHTEEDKQKSHFQLGLVGHFFTSVYTATREGVYRQSKYGGFLASMQKD